jgi:branched-chain amino acid transport system substrate-binding protein
MLAPNSATLPQALQVVQVNDKRLQLLGGDSAYNPKTLELGRSNSVGMVLAVPWHILGNPNAEFPKAANQLWGGEVNWRTAMAYDAAKALIAAIGRNPSRSGVQQALSASAFLLVVLLEGYSFYHQVIAIRQYSW